ncbi:MAG: hypothetical protein A2W91_07835 [Bacteroidetes bacterium GWF2_38_335]|nr:MAG: hypothetical protein A2W91_07835 [Bacteroidetes bacterium GWF2_38_335]OFY79038.1 MAG: hypothetical protein A2281_02885 [Bacteroidetes bacterium RIFOXYA12_FULL_38_20]HBS86118.1 hypothetical protein [Bacteroidales bacterium]
MRFIIVYITLFVFLISGTAQNAYCQDKPTFGKARKLFDDKEYDRALEMFLNLYKAKSEDFELNFYIGACYLNSDFEKVKAIPYLEYAVSKKADMFPSLVFKDLADLYHMDYQFDKSIENYRKYLSFTDKNKNIINIEYAEKMIRVCETAKRLTADSLKVIIEKIPGLANSDDSDIFPLVSADESVMYFTRKTANEKPFSQKKETIMFSRLTESGFSDPQEIRLSSENKFEGVMTLAGISPDGDHIFLKVSNGENDDLYTGIIINGEVKYMVPFNNKINSAYSELSMSMTADGQDIYFSSDRPGGLGGYDIYTITKDEHGNWSEPKNLGPTINTETDDIAPFIHPDKQTLYFSSKGHDNMGGYDIFKTLFYPKNDVWASPENAGFPVNSTGDDIFFTLNVDGSIGYFSSSYNNLYGNHDIYKASFQNSIPLTLVKGTILAGDPLKPVKANIRVVDKTSNERVKYIYNPNPETGKYLMIFPPGKNYDMVIEAEGYLPHRLNIYIPNQTYFYELFQIIHLEPVKSLGEVIGEEITVTNSFFDIYDNSNDSARHNYSELLSMIEELIVTTDSLGLEYIDKISSQVINKTSNPEDISKEKNYDGLLNLIENAIETTDSAALRKLDENTIYSQKSGRIYFYGLSEDKTELVPCLIGKDTVYTLPPIIMKDEDKYPPLNLSDLTNEKTDSLITSLLNNNIAEENTDFRNSDPNRRKTVLTYVIYFETGKFDIKEDYINDIKQLADMLKNYNLGAEIYGFTDDQGDDEKNNTLSQQRATAVFEIFSGQGITPRKAIVKGKGEIISGKTETEVSRGKHRKTVINIFEIE